MSDHDQVWTAAAQLLRAQVSEAVWLSTFQDAHPLPDVDEVIRIGVPSSHVRDKITTRYLPLVEDALAEIGAGSRRLVVEVHTGADMHDDPLLTDHVGHDRAFVGGGDHGAHGSAAVATLASSAAPRRHPNPNAAALNDGLEPALHVRDVRQGRLQPVRPRRRPARRRDAGAARTTRCSSTARPVWARPTCCTPSATTSTRTTSTTMVRYVSTETFLNEYVDAIRTNTTRHASSAATATSTSC